MSERAVFVVDPLVLVKHMLPPGNAITGLTVTDDGILVFEFCGIDVPREELGVQRMVLMGGVEATGRISHWFERAAPHHCLAANLAPLSHPPSDG